MQSYRKDFNISALEGSSVARRYNTDGTSHEISGIGQSAAPSLEQAAPGIAPDPFKLG